MPDIDGAGMTRPFSVAIVGAGPAGFYAADALLRRGAPCRIDIIDRWPAPFGLVRAGVAPDHQSTKNVIRLYDRTLQDPRVRFAGNVALGETLGFDDLKTLYDAAILSFGAQRARRLGIPGEDRAGVFDATQFVDWYNAVPAAEEETAAIAESVRAAEAAVVVGNGNVALDIARLLAKTGGELAAGDIDPAAAAAIAAAPLRDIYIVGRRGPAQASFTAPELREFGGLAAAAPVVAAADLPENADAAPEAERRKKTRNLGILRGYAETESAARERPARIHFLFLASPIGIEGGARMTAVRFRRNRLEDGRAKGTGETFSLAAQLLVSAIGYRAADAAAGIPIDERSGGVANAGGRVEPGVYVTGWARRGPTGMIGTNRNDARDVVEAVMADGPAPGKPGPDGLDALLRARGVRAVDYAAWRRIDAAEIAAAAGCAGDRPRLKFARVTDMLAAARAPAPRPD